MPFMELCDPMLLVGAASSRIVITRKKKYPHHGEGEEEEPCGKKALHLEGHPNLRQ